jgi:hypothetical protein
VLVTDDRAPRAMRHQLAEEHSVDRHRANTSGAWVAQQARNLI